MGKKLKSTHSANVENVDPAIVVYRWSVDGDNARISGSSTNETVDVEFFIESSASYTLHCIVDDGTNIDAITKNFYYIALPSNAVLHNGVSVVHGGNIVVHTAP